ncbi:RNA polymerase III C11 subunit [Trypanosoma grayi]|uniref:RNA polymerase III C11 subunit n=1 Tax=Trypanosoma grayi TaxID=71804 RepID=UPI0004F4443B|nr:RNA polymerase III C11 subunit [Trypanosoma grayi]KEG10184.1 RNA polymerase III C11 subunit [Trypanosoma grayi]
MFFCPFCGTLLLNEPHYPTNRFTCSSCTYVAPILSSQPLTVNHSLLKYNKVVEDDSGAAGAGAKQECVKKEEVAEEDVVGGQVITVRCQNEACDGNRAQYMQIQMRSADEPATTFFKCLKCGLQWRQD